MILVRVIFLGIFSFSICFAGMLMGGEKKKSEKARLRKGINILIGTPGKFCRFISLTIFLCRLGGVVASRSLPAQRVPGSIPA